MINDEYRYFMKHFDTGEEIEVPGESIERISLEKIHYTDVLPLTQGNFTQVSNYMLQFWRPFIKPTAFSIWMSLAMRAWGNKDEAWPARPLIAAECGIDVKTFDRQFPVLEQYYLAWKIRVINQEGINESNIYKVRKNMPFLTQDLYDSLPRELQKSHDKYIKNLERSGEVIVPEYEHREQSAKQRLKFQRPEE